MRKLFKLLLCICSLLALSSVARAQGIQFTLSPPIPNGTAYVCNYPAPTVPCSNFSSIFSNSSLTTPISQPVSLGSTGALSFYAAAGTYQVYVLVSGSLNNGFILPLGAPGPTHGSTLTIQQAGVTQGTATIINFAANATATVSGGVATVTPTNTAATAFSALTGATNTTAAMLCGTGCSIGTSGSGSLSATTLLGGTWASPGAAIGSGTPVAGTFTTFGATNGTFSGTLGVTGASTLGTLTATGASTFGAVTATGAVDFSGSSISKLRVGAGLTTSANGDFGFDSTNNNWHGWNGADYIFAPLASGFVSGDCGQPTQTGGKWVIADAGASCGTGGGGSSPGGSGSNLQFRSGASTFGGVPGSAVDSAGGLNLTPTGDTVGAQLVPTSSGFADPFEVFNQTVVASPAAPTASSVAGGSLGAQTLLAKIAYVDFRGVLTIAGTETTSQAVTASHLLTLAAPSPNAVGAAGYIPFVTASGGGTGTETQQVASGNCTLATGLPTSAPAACALSATWTEPTAGIAAGANPPGSNLTRQKAAWFDVSGNLNGLWFSQTLQDQTGSNFARIKLFGSTVAMGAYQWVTSAGANPVSLSGSSTLNAVCVIGGNPTGTDCPSGSPKLGDIFLTPALTTVSGLASSPPTGTLANVSDGTGATDCTTGGGSTLVTCRWSGAAWAAVGGGGGSSSVNVNGSAVSSPNFNGTTPAAGAGNSNCTWQVSVSSISCEMPNVTTINGSAFTLGAATAPLGTLQDTNGNSTILSSAATTPVNQITVANAATGAAPSASATGTDTNIELDLNSKGNLGVKLSGGGTLFNVGGSSGAITATMGAGDNINFNMNAAGVTTFTCGATAANKCFTVKEGLAAPTNDQIIEANSSGTSLASFGPNGIFHDSGTQIISAADYTNSTVTPSTVFSWTLPATAAAKNYRYSCDITWESTNTTLVGPVLGLNLSAAPTQLTGTGYVKSALNSITSAEAEGYLSNTTTGSQTLVTGNAAGVTSTNYYAKIWGTIEGAATAGSTFIINAASTSGTTATLNIRRGSSCVMTSTN